MKHLYLLTALCGCWTTVLAETSETGYTIETRWVAVTTATVQQPRGVQLPNGTIVDTSLHQATVDNDYAQLFELQARVTNVIGQPNGGLFTLRGHVRTSSISMSDTVLTNKTTAGILGLGDRSPYNYGISTEQYLINNAPSSNTRVDAIDSFAAEMSDSFTSLWTYNFETGQPNPLPTPPPGAGTADDWVSAYRIRVDIRPTDVIAHTAALTIAFTHHEFEPSTAAKGYTLTNDPTPPDDFSPVVEASWHLEQMTSSSLNGYGNHLPAAFRINVLPAPSAAGLLSLGGLIASRRRRN